MTNAQPFAEYSAVDGFRTRSAGVLELSTGEVDSPTAVVEAYYDRYFSAIKTKNALRHSAMPQEIAEPSLLETRVTASDLDREQLSERTELDEKTIETILSGDVALVEATVQSRYDGALREDTLSWVVATEDGSWRLLVRDIVDAENEG